MKHLQRYKLYESKESKVDLIRSKVLKLKSRIIQNIWDLLLDFKDEGLEIEFYLLMKGTQFSLDNLDTIYMFKVDEDENGLVLSTQTEEEIGYSYFDHDYYDDALIRWILVESDPDLLIEDSLIFLLETDSSYDKYEKSFVDEEYSKIERRLNSIYDIDIFESHHHMGEKRLMFSATEK